MTDVETAMKAMYGGDGPVQDALERMGERDYGQFKKDLRRREARSGRLSNRARRRLVHDYVRDDAGNALPKGYPLGRPLREDGQSHRQGWMAVLRLDPCAYCGRPSSGTVDHIEPQRGRAARGLGGIHSWTNLIGACESCNTHKSNEPMLMYLLRKKGVNLPKHRPHDIGPKAKKVANSVKKQQKFAKPKPVPVPQGEPRAEWLQAMRPEPSDEWKRWVKNLGKEGMKSQEARRRAA